MKRILQAALFLGFLMLFAGQGLAAPFTWTETGDAGNLPATANITFGGNGPLNQILGNLSLITDVDLFAIWIADFVNFSATTEDGINSVDDPQLFLFNSAGKAVYMNDDGAGLGSQSQLPAGDLLGPKAAGLYYLGIGWFDNEPFSALGRMFQDGSGTTGPDIGGASAVTSWNSDVIGRDDLPTAYSIRLTGVSPVPEPSVMGLLATSLAGLLLCRKLLAPAVRRP